MDSERRREIAAAIAPLLRGLVSAEKRQILRFEDGEDVLGFASSKDAPRLTQIGAACPDHLVHTKPWPLLVDWTPEQDTAALETALRAGVAGYVAKYSAYLEANAQQDLDPDASETVLRAADAASDPHPRVILIPGVGMFTTGKDATMADVAAQLYHRAIAVMRGAEACGGFISLTDAESYAVEYWPLEQYKLKLAPPEREFARQVALVTGAAGGIGSAICLRLARDGAHVVLADIDLEGAQRVADEINQQIGAGRAVAVQMDVTDEDACKQPSRRRRWPLAASIRSSTTPGWPPARRSPRRAWPSGTGTGTCWRPDISSLRAKVSAVLQQQGRGGQLVFVASKNALVAGKNAAAYSTAKAAEAHLARCLAEEGGQFGIRVNTVNPDAVLSGSRIWDSAWRQERAATYGVAPEQLEEVYRKRTTLGVSSCPRTSPRRWPSSLHRRAATKSTGNILNVDGGVAAAYPR